MAKKLVTFVRGTIAMYLNKAYVETTKAESTYEYGGKYYKYGGTSADPYADAVYFATDTNEIFMGGKNFGGGASLIARIKSLEDLLTQDKDSVKGVIDTWNEIVAFLAGINNTNDLSALETLMSLLAKKLDVTTFETFKQAYAQKMAQITLAIGGLQDQLTWQEATESSTGGGNVGGGTIIDFSDPTVRDDWNDKVLDVVGDSNTDPQS